MASAHAWRQMIDLVKIAVGLALYGVAGPLIGLALAGRRRLELLTLGVMLFMTSWHINKFTFMVNSIETYRGHTKGFEVSLIQVLAIALLVSGARSGAAWVGKRWIALWLVHCFAATLSLFAAPEPSYVLMAAWKFSSAVLVLAAALRTVRDEEGLLFIARAAVLTLAVQAAVVLKLRYVDGHYQVRGWFEHQNPLAMWAYMLGLPCLALAMADVGARGTRWFAAGFAASGLIVYGSLSRAALAVFVVGAAGVALFGLLADRFTLKRLRVILGMGALGLLALPFVADTVISRFNDEGNQASGETRTVMNLAAKAMLDDSFVGIGWNNFALTINPPWSYGDVIDDWERDRGHRVDPDYKKGVVENHYWLLLAENGWPGFLTYMLFIMAAAAALLRRWRNARGTIAGAYQFGIFAALTLIHLHSYLERVLTQTKNLSAYMILLGAALGLSVGKHAREHDRTSE